MKNFDFDPPHDDVKSHAASGFIFSSASQLVRIITQFLSVIVLARLLEPSDFGLIAMVTPVYSFAMLFNNLGLNQATIQKPKITSEEVNSFFWISVGVSMAVCLLLIALSPVVSWFYKEPRTAPLTIAMALLIITSGLGNQHGAIMVRRMQFRLQGILGMVSIVASLIGSVIWAYLFGGYWSLYVGLAVGSIISLAGVWLCVKWRPSAPAIAPETTKMLRYGLGITGTYLADFIAGAVNNAAIGHVLGERTLGLFDRASKLMSAPLAQMVNPISNVVGPILYRLEHDADRYRRTFLRMLASLTLAITPGVIWAISLPDVLITTLLGAKWVETIPIFVPLSLSALPLLINSAVWWLVVTQGRAGDTAKWGMFNAVASIAALFIGLPFGIVAVANATAISHFIRAPFLWWYASRVGPVNFGHIIRTLIPQTVGGVASFTVLKLLQSFELFGPWSLMIVGLILSYAVALMAIALFPSGRVAIARDYGFLKYMIKKILGRIPPADVEPVL